MADSAVDAVLLIVDTADSSSVVVLDMAVPVEGHIAVVVNQVAVERDRKVHDCS